MGGCQAGTTSGRKESPHERGRHRRQFADAAGEVVSRIVQPDAAGRPGRALHSRRPAEGAATRSGRDRGRLPRLRRARGPAGGQRRASRVDPRRPAGERRGRDGEPLLLVRVCRPSPWPLTRSCTRAPRPPSAAASRASRPAPRASATPTRGCRRKSPASTWSWATPPRSSRSATRSAARCRTSTPFAANSAPRGRSKEGFFKEELAPMKVARGMLDKQTGQVVGKEEHTDRARRVQPPRHDARGPSLAQAALRPQQRAGHGHGRELIATFRRRIGRAPDVARSARRNSASSPWVSSAASRSRGASRTRWASARSSPCRSC